jgi:chromosome segregation ATPase
MVFGVMGVRSVLAQTSSAASFDHTLETLRQSVVRLVKENEQINAGNLLSRSKIKSLQEELRSLEAEAARVEAKKAAEIQKVQSHSGGVAALKAQVAEVDGALKQVRDDLTAEQVQFKALENEERDLQQKADVLRADVAAMNKPGSSSEKARDEVASLQAEQGVLQQQLFDIVNRVQQAKQQWQDMNAVVTTGPQQLVSLQAEQDAFAKALPQAEADLANLGVQLTDMQTTLDKLRSEDYSDTRSGRLDSEIKDMAERNRKLESEILTTTKISEEKQERFKADQEKTQKEYQARQDELSQRNVDLKFELESLRKQMVDLDKKKSLLEAALYPTP